MRFNLADKKTENGGKNQNKDKKSGGLIVKKHAHKEQIAVAKQPFVLHQTKSRKDHGEECPKVELRE